MKYILGLLTFLTLISCDDEVLVDPYAIGDKTRDSIYLKVQELYTAQKYTDAEKLLNSIRARDIYDLGYYSFNAKVKYNLQKYSDAIHFINSALRVDNSNSTIYFIKAQCYSALELQDSAIMCLNKAISLDSTNKGYIFARMQFYKGTKIPILQFDDINRLLRLDSNNLKFHSYMALFYYEQGDTNSALHIYENILQKESYNVDALKSIGTINFVRNKIKIAKSYYEKCIQYDPTDGEVFMAMASILDKEKKPDRSCDCLLKAVDLGDREAMKHIYKCEEYLRKKGIGIKIDKDTINNTTTVQKTTEI